MIHIALMSVLLLVGCSQFGTDDARRLVIKADCDKDTLDIDLVIEKDEAGIDFNPNK